MKRIIILLSSLLLLLTGCGGNSANGSYEQITQEAAKEMMDTQEVIILDVREQDVNSGSRATSARTFSHTLTGKQPHRHGGQPHS